jgi:hypothetical protein
VLATPVTSAPYAFAIWTANVPTPPEAPMTSTRSRAVTCPWSRTAWSAVSPEIGRAAACSNVRCRGLGASFAAAAGAYSAKPPSATPKTSSPGRNVVTAEPTASTRPATSRPRTGVFGARTP